MILLTISMLKNLQNSAKRIAIVDDESGCQLELKTLIERLFPDLVIVFVADSLETARKDLKQHPLDLIFLDVQLKDGNSFELLGDLNENTRVIFTTGYDNFAVRAFEVNALHYLLKPVQEDHLQRAMQIYYDKSKRDKTLPLIRPDDDVLLQEDGMSRFVPIREIICIRAEKDYTLVETTKRKWFVRRSIVSWESQLPVTMFLRIHRSYLVNVNHIKSTKKMSAGRYQIHLNEAGEGLVSSRRYGNRLKRVFDPGN